MDNLTPSTKTIRVSYCDPDATDSSSDEGSGKSQIKSKRKVHEIEVEFAFAVNNQNPRSDSGYLQEETGLKKPNLATVGKKISGVRITKSGEFWVEIKDPIKKIWVWLGLFGTAEEASRAYLAEESKFAAEKLRDKQRVEWAAPENSTFQDSVPLVINRDNTNPTSAVKRFEGVRMSESGKFGASIRDLLKKKNVWLGSFTTGEEASMAYFAKKAQIEAKQLRVMESQFEAKQLRAKRSIVRLAAHTSDLKSSQEGVRKSIFGVRRKKGGKYSANIMSPITKRRVFIGNFGTKENATRAYLAKEAEFEHELRAIQGLERRVASSAPDSVYSSDLSNETGASEYVGENKVSGEEEAGFGFFHGVQVVDRNGFLVGEFSMLDDLRICSEEEDANS
ncbi:uncharacterized protein [Henckelia pumila]|uniref:uncharacterized protein n=1 Tax=Henckelia pumila TaxID=405737 RepID=UPI003C6E14C7